MKKITVFVAFILLVCFVASSCTSSEKTEKTASELAEAITHAVPLESGYYRPSDAYFDYYFSENDGSSLTDRCVSDWAILKSSSQSSENEIGILLCRDGAIGEVKDACEDYLEDRREAYLEAKAAYTPEEYEKYRDAELRVYGNCVIYFILNSTDRAAAVSAFESALSK